MIIKLIPKTDTGQAIVASLGNLWKVDDIMLPKSFPSLGVELQAAYQIHSILQPTQSLAGQIFQNWRWLEIEDEDFDWTIVN